MRELLRRLFKVREYADPTDQERARTLQIISVGLFGLTVVFGVVAVIVDARNPSGLVEGALPILGIALVTLLLTYGFTQVGRVGIASVVFVGSLLVANLVAGLPRFGLSEESLLIGWALPVVAAGLLMGGSASLVTAIISMILIGSQVELGAGAVTAAERQELLVDEAVRFTVTGVVLFSITLISWLFIGNVQRRANEALRRTEQMRATSLVSQAAAQARDLSTLLNETVELIRQTFGYYHAQVFLVDSSGQYALLRASTGEAGRVLLARGHRLPVGSQSVIGQVTAQGEPVIASDVSVDPVHQRNELLPDTRAEMALPMHAGERIIGALDVQSVDAYAFDSGDVETLQVMANQIATSIENVRLLSEITNRAAENERLLEEAQTNLQQIEALNRSLTRRGWREYLGARSAASTVGYTMQGRQVSEDTRWTAGMRAAVSEQRVVIGGDGGSRGSQTVSVPLSVRGEVIGVVEVERDERKTWEEKDLELVALLAERLSLALDNARLLEQADTLAHREQMVNEITQNVQQAESVDDLLQSALVELGRVLGASRGVVQLSPRREAAPADTAQLQDDGGRPPYVADAAESEEDRP